MKKEIKIRDYDCVEDILLEALDTLCGITSINAFEDLEKDVEYVCGAINIVKLGDKPNTLKHKQGDKWSNDVEVSESYANTMYFRVDQMQKLVTNHLTMKHYNQDLCKYF